MFVFTNSHCFGEALETTLPQFLMMYFIKHTENKKIYIFCLLQGINVPFLVEASWK